MISTASGRTSGVLRKKETRNPYIIRLSNKYVPYSNIYPQTLILVTEELNSPVCALFKRNVQKLLRPLLSSKVDTNGLKTPTVELKGMK